jgi:cell division protein FtsB
MRPMMRASVVDNPTLERDMSTNAVINRNKTEYSRRLQVKKNNQKKEQELENLKAEITQLKELVNSLISNIK